MINALIFCCLISIFLNVHFLNVIIKQDQQLLRTQKLLKYLDSIFKK